MIVYLYGIMAALAAVGAEVVYSRAASFWSRPVMLSMVVCQPVIAYSIYHMVKSSTNLVLAVVVFSLSTIVLRIAASLLILGQPVTTGTWAAVVLLILAQFARRF